jgi:SOS response regulatory protein OraA/RecX
LETSSILGALLFMNILKETKISVFKSVYDTNNSYTRSLEFCLNRIKNGDVKDKVEHYRETRADIDKRRLSGFCFNGTFAKRDSTGLIELSGLMVLDFDKFANQGKALDFKEYIKIHDFVLAAFISPSNKGVKVVVRIPKDKENFTLYFNALKKHFDHPNWDDSGKDIARFCFESYDPEIYINENAKVWDTIEEEEYTEIGKEYKEVVVPLSSESQIIDKLTTWFEGKYKMGSGERNNNMFKLAMSFNDFGVSQFTALAVLERYQEKDFSKSEIEAVVNSAYKRGKGSFHTKFFDDNNVKKNIQKQILSGKSPKQIQKALTLENVTIDEDVIEKVKENMEVEEFWNISEKGKISLSPLKFKRWLEQNNFMKYYPSNGNTYTFIKKEQNFIEETNEKKIKDFVLDYLLSNDTIGIKPYDYIAGNPQFFTPNYLSFLKSAEITLREDTQTECYIYYHNCAVRVTKEKVERIDYLNLEGYVWKDQIISRDYNPIDHHNSEFREFIWLISGKDVAKYNTFKSVIGYLLHSFKTSANNKAIIFNDETISENPNGGSGKGVFWNALAKMKKVSMIDGKRFEFAKDFPYQTVSTDCQILVFDDVKKNFNFESLFSVITEGITIEYKGQDAIKIPISKSPKILITTNYTIGGVGGSFERRKFEVEFSSYFGAHYSPVDHFKHMLFDAWSEEEWSRFDSYMVNCLQYYLQHGLVENNFNNLEIRKFIKETSFDFYEWTSEGKVPTNERLYRGKLYEEFLNEYQDYRKWLKEKTFKKWIEKYAEFKKMQHKDGKDLNGRYSILEPTTETIINPFL